MKYQILVKVFYIQKSYEVGFVSICIFTSEEADEQRGEGSEQPGCEQRSLPSKPALYQKHHHQQHLGPCWERHILRPHPRPTTELGNELSGWVGCTLKFENPCETLLLLQNLFLHSIIVLKYPRRDRHHWKYSTDKNASSPRLTDKRVRQILKKDIIDIPSSVLSGWRFTLSVSGEKISWTSALFLLMGRWRNSCVEGFSHLPPVTQQLIIQRQL